MVFGSFDPRVLYTERIAAYVVIRSEDGAVAAVAGRTAHFLPGGGREGDETPEQTVRREVREELGRDIHLITRLGEATQYFFAASDNCHYKMHAVFFAARFTGAASNNEPDLLHWLPASDAASHFFHACHTWAVQTFRATDDAEMPADSAKSPGSA